MRNNDLIALIEWLTRRREELYQATHADMRCYEEWRRVEDELLDAELIARRRWLR